MKVAIRDDDACYFTRPETLERVYHDVWNDVPDGETLAQTTRGIAPRLRLIAQKTWGSKRPAHDYDGFLALWNRVRP